MLRSRGQQIAAIAVGILIVAGGSAGAWWWLRDPYEAPDLTLRTEFPVGYEYQEFNPGAISFDGMSRCTGLASVFTGNDWTHDGVVYTSTRPTADEVLAANPLRLHGYGYGPASRPVSENHTSWSIRAGLNCEFEYKAYAWSSASSISNIEPVTIRDARGQPYAFANTAVHLGGDGDGHGGTRFLLTATTAPDTVLEFAVFADDSLRHDRLLYRGTARALAAVGSNSTIVFDIPPLAASQAQLVLIPTLQATDGTSTAAQGTVLHELFRLETDHAEILTQDSTMGTPNLSPEPSSLISSRNLGGVLNELDEAGATLSAASNVAIVVQHAFEPGAPPGRAKLYQELPHAPWTVTTHLDLTQASRVESLAAEHAWTASAKTGTFTARVSLPPANLARAAATTASVTQIGADGFVIARAAAEGPSVRGAIEATHRALDIRGHALELDSPQKTPASFLEGSQKYFLAAGVLAAGWEWSAARGMDDPVQSFVQDVKAARILAETIFSLSPQGALWVAATNLGEFVLAKIVPAELVELLGRGLNEIVLGRVTEEVARDAYAKVGPKISTFARQNGGGVLPFQMSETNEVPGLGLIPIVALLAILARSTARRRQ
jgi:hypothetical protein